MEMEMRAVEDIEMGQDLTQPLRPLCFELTNSDSVSRAALRLLRFPSDAHRIAGLLTNRLNLLPRDDDAVTATTAAVCAVLTNAVEARGGIAVYGPDFSWINHSCSPNAAYHFSDDDDDSNLRRNRAAARIVPHGGDHQSWSLPESEECFCDGPSVTVRSVKAIGAGEPVTVAYTDLLQPKAVRQSELWSKYRFICSCPRCTADPPSYVDHVLEEISVADLDPSSCSAYAFCKDEATKLFTEYLDEAVAHYLSLDDPRSCCEKLERALTRGLLGTSRLTYWLNPLHHLALNAYTALASAYKARAIDGNVSEAFDRTRTSAAYSMLLAGAANHLFRLEPCLIVSAANYWVNAGESLVTLARSEFMPETSHSSAENYRCPNCTFCGQVNQYLDLEKVSREFIDCITDYVRPVWCFLVRGSCHLRVFKDPIEFGWLESVQYSTLWANGNGDDESSCERIKVFQLGAHCLAYGGYLATICFGEHSYLTSQAQAVLNGEHKTSQSS